MLLSSNDHLLHDRSKCQPSEKFYTGVVKSGIVESVLQWAKFKADNLLHKTASGRKQNKIKGGCFYLYGQYCEFLVPTRHG